MKIDELKSHGADPSWFGLGFIQLKIDDHNRYHFWHPELTEDVSPEEVHDHRYDFTSRVILGEITHEIYEFIPSQSIFKDVPFEMVTVSCDPTKMVPDVRQQGYLNLVGSHTMVAGSSYTFYEEYFHRTRATKAITHLQRDGRQKEFARVIKPYGAPQVCPFSNPKPVKELWDYIEDIIGKDCLPGYHLSEIEKGVLGEPSKIREETEEFLDAIKQGVDIMALVELSDLVGAIELYLQKHHGSMSIADLKAMSDVTKRAFQNGRRN